MFKYPQALKIHKKTAQLQLDLKPAKEVQDPTSGKARVEEGCVFFSLAKALDDQSGKMDWNNKILMKIDHNDIAKIVMGVRSGKNVDIFHKTADDRSSTLKVEAGQPGTFKLVMGKKDGANSGMASVYLNTEDMFIIFNLLEAAIPLTLGWN